MSDAELRRRLAEASGLSIAFAPTSIDATIEWLEHAGGPAIALDPSTAWLAAVAATMRRSNATVLAGSRGDLEACVADTRWAHARSRLFLAADWRVDADAALFGRRGAAHVEPFITDRPRTLGESPEPMSERVRAALVWAATSADLRRYPPVRPTRLIERIARREGVDVSQIVVSGGGSHELLGRVLRACADAGDVVLARSPTYDGLHSLCLREGLVLGLVDWLDVPGRARVVYALMPGLDGADPQNLRQIREMLDSSRLLVVDEAYAGFDDVALALPDSERGPVLRLRTLSKLNGLAGLRVGYAIGPAPIIKLLEAFGDPFAISEMAEEAAIAAIDDDAHRARTRRDVARWRTVLVDGLRARGFEVPDSPTHLIAARPPPERLAAIVARAEAKSLPLEESPSMPGWLQLSVLDDAGTAALFAALDSNPAI